MFWKKRKGTMRIYSVPDQLAWEWPRALLPLGLSVDITPKWARTASGFNGGCPWGRVVGQDGFVQMGSEFLKEEDVPYRPGDLMPGYHIQFMYEPNSTLLADRIDAVLREHGATLRVTYSP